MSGSSFTPALVCVVSSSRCGAIKPSTNQRAPYCSLKNVWLRQPQAKNATGRVAARPRALLRRSASPLSFAPPPTLGRINLSSLLVFSCDLEATKETMKRAGLLHACYPAASRRDNNMTGSQHKEPVLRSKNALKSLSKSLPASPKQKIKR